MLIEHLLSYILHPLLNYIFLWKLTISIIESKDHILLLRNFSFQTTLHYLTLHNCLEILELLLQLYE